MSFPSSTDAEEEKRSPLLPYAPEDVLALKGGAAQQTTHPGNLVFYKLCEERFAEYKSLPEGCQKRRDICLGIIDRCGTFRKRNLHPMKLADAIIKCQDRMRRISKPKVKIPFYVGENDVVFTVGGTNHLYPGNPKFRALCDEYFDRYWPNLFNHQVNKNPGVVRKTAYQIATLEELVSKLKQKGGQFRGANLRVLSDEDAYRKIHGRFKDMKRLALQKGQFEKTTAESYVLRRAGCTSTHAAVDVDDPNRSRKHQQKRCKTLKRKMTGTTKKRVFQPTQSDNDDDDENSFHSSILTDSENDNDNDDDNDDVNGDGEEEEEEEERRRRVDDEQRKLQQSISRHERLVRRRQLQQDPTSRRSDQVQPQQKRRRQSKQRNIKKSNYLPPEETPDMSDYERLRVQNMKRNYERLKKLGLV